MIIGITGGSGSGKSSLARLLGCKVIDADKIYRRLLETNGELRAELTAEFGTCEREGIAGIVFSDKEKLQRLNDITFKYTLAAIEAEIPPQGGAVIDAPLLFESGLDSRCDATVAVIAEKPIRIKRIMERDGLTSEQAEARVNARKPDEFFIKKADYTVRSDCGCLADAAKALLGKMRPQGKLGKL
jgi:dephospho-CoA kinase